MSKACRMIEPRSPYSSCPKCGEYALHTLAKITPDMDTATWKQMIRQSGVECWECPYRSDKPPWYIRETLDSFLIRVDDGLRNTRHGLARAVSILPMSLRRSIKSYRMAGEIRAGPYRWWRVEVER